MTTLSATLNVKRENSPALLINDKRIYRRLISLIEIGVQPRPNRYLLEEKHLSLDNRFTITDESGVVHYKANSTFFAVGDKLSICDQHGNELLRIRQDYPHFHLTYKVLTTREGTGDEQIASVKRTGPIWQYKLKISSPDGEYILQKQGGAASNELNLLKDGNIIAVATKDASLTKSFYWVDIQNDKEENHVFILTMFIIFSCAQRLPGNPMTKPQNNTPKD